MDRNRFAEPASPIGAPVEGDQRILWRLPSLSAQFPLVQATLIRGRDLVHGQGYDSDWAAGVLNQPD